MSNFDRVTQRWSKLKFMDERRAQLVRKLMIECDATNLLEIGFWKGKSSAYFAAILEDLGRGHLTTIDRRSARTKSPNLVEVLRDLGLEHRVTPIYATRSHTWELARMIRQDEQPRFDFCYFDGGHTWDVTGFGLVLVDLLMKPGGVIVVDDLNWSIKRSVERNPRSAQQYADYSDDEKDATPVRMAWDIILPRLGYKDLTEEKSFSWGIARKPLSES